MEKKYKVLTVALCVSTILSTTGCASTSNVSNMVLGCAWGATVGTVAGLIAGKGNIEYAIGGAAVGLIAGCGVGYYMDEREEEIAKHAEENGFKTEFERLQIQDGKTNFSVDAEDDVIASQVALTTDKPMFKSGASTISDAKMRRQLDAFLVEYVRTLDKKSKIYVVGHTDSSGSAAYNQKLSEKRAYYIAKRLNQFGLDKDRIFFEGVGENQPITSNATKSGMAKNRRFELIDVFVDDVAKGAASLDQVVQVSQSKKQRIENVMTPVALERQAEEKAHKVALIKAEKEGTSLDKIQVSPNKSIKSTAKTPSSDVNVKDVNPLNLHGKPLDNTASSEQLVGKLGSFVDDSWGVFPKAHASDLASVKSCGISEPKVQSKIKTLGSTVYEPSVAKGLPALYGTYWYGKATSPLNKNETMVVLGPVFVNKDTFKSEKQPQIHFTKNYQSSKQKPNYSYKNTVEIYRGDNTLLYRVYPSSKNAKFDCADLIFNAKGQKSTQHAEIVYSSKGTTFSRVMELKTNI